MTNIAVGTTVKASGEMQQQLDEGRILILQGGEVQETQDMKLAEDKLVFVYTEMMQNSCYSEKYAEFFKKSLHYCIPF